MGNEQAFNRLAIDSFENGLDNAGAWCRWLGRIGQTSSKAVALLDSPSFLHELETTTQITAAGAWINKAPSNQTNTMANTKLPVAQEMAFSRAIVRPSQ